MRLFSFFLTIALIALSILSCGPLESGVLDTGALNTGGTDDPRRLIEVAYSRLYGSNRVIGARNVLKRAIQQSILYNDLYALTVSYNMMGYTYIQKEKDPNIAEGYYNKAVKIAVENNFHCELVHAYIGLSLTNNLTGIYENSCVYKDKARKLVDQIKKNYKKEVLICEGGWKSIDAAEKRLNDLNSYLKCGKDK